MFTLLKLDESLDRSSPILSPRNSWMHLLSNMQIFSIFFPWSPMVHNRCFVKVYMASTPGFFLTRYNYIIKIWGLRHGHRSQGLHLDARAASEDVGDPAGPAGPASSGFLADQRLDVSAGRQQFLPTKPRVFYPKLIVHRCGLAVKWDDFWCLNPNGNFTILIACALPLVGQTHLPLT